MTLPAPPPITLPRRLPALLLAGLALLSPLAAQDWTSTQTSPRPGPHPAIPPQRLEFQLSWKGMVQAGTVRIDFAPKDARKPGLLVVRSSARSTGAASSLFPYEHSFWSEIHPNSLRPRYFHAVEKDKKETVTTIVHHHPGLTECEETTRNHKSGKSNTRNHEFRHAPVFDLFSAMLHVRSQKLAKGDRIRIVIQPFENPYLLDVESHGPEVHEGRKAIRLTVSMRKINRDTRELIPYRKLKRPATLWLTDDADRIPLELRAAVFIGDVRATLKSSEHFR